MEHNYEKWARNNGRQATNRPTSSQNANVDKIINSVNSMPWLWSALGSFAISAGISALKSPRGIGKLFRYVGPAVLLYGLYHQLVKQQSDGVDRDELH